LSLPAAKAKDTVLSKTGLNVAIGPFVINTYKRLRATVAVKLTTRKLVMGLLSGESCIILTSTVFD